MINNNTIPWVEKYRPNTIKEIVLENNNRTIINNIIKTKQFPNLLLFGPPGTGKTTTIINLIRKYQEINEVVSKDVIIDLNASDERGIDIIRTQIQQFVMSKNLFSHGTKFIILDEVDYMTKNAQQALKNIIQLYKNMKVRFCLICNYISRIEKCLQEECMNLRFTQLPKEEVILFLNTIIKNEKLNLSKKDIEYIYKSFNYDIRSMINYLQTNQNSLNKIKLINEEVIKLLLKKINNNVNEFYLELYNISVKYNIERFTIIENILEYLLNNYNNDELIKCCKFILHNDNEFSIDHCIKYIGFKIKDLDL
jgi:DNA polymerase III delta prime subunit